VAGILWIALAAQLSLPLPANGPLSDVRAVFSTDDFPVYVIQEGVSRIVLTRTTVRPDGSIQSCVAERPSGDAKLDAYTCGLILKRARFLPARWIDGSPAYGVIRLPISWLVGDPALSEEDTLRAVPPDLELSVNRLPKGAHKIATVSLEVAADENGHVVSCAENPEKPPRGIDHSPHFPELVPIACEQVTKTLSLHPPLDASGKPVRSVQRASATFKVAH